jgi:cell division septum initiation protein DivIVA
MSGADNQVGDLEARIEQTREELAETVEALTQRADVKGRAKAKAAEATQEAKARAAALAQDAKVKAAGLSQGAGEKANTAVVQIRAQQSERPWLLPAIGASAGLAAVAALLAVLRRRRS